jgi:LysM repeat protein/3D (Asp-Asp-Asp) domain-containing protein
VIDYQSFTLQINHLSNCVPEHIHAIIRNYFESQVFLSNCEHNSRNRHPKVVFTINKSLFTLSIVAGFLGLTGVSASANSYTVKSGDTLSAIAQRNHASLDGIIKENKISNKNLITVGQTLEISKANKKAPAKKAAAKKTTAKKVNKSHFKTSMTVKKGSAHAAVVTSSSSSSNTNSNPTSNATTTPAAMQSQGVVYLNGNKWTYYTGAGFADGTTNHGGYDADGYIIVAAPSNVPFGTHIQTPLGEGVVHDRGTAIVGNHYDLVMP